MSGEYIELSTGGFTVRVMAANMYTEDGVWLAPDEAHHTIRIGLTDYRQRLSGPMTYVELPERGMAFDAGEEVAGIEAANTDVSVLAPCTGTVMALNEALATRPELINADPYGSGWLVELHPDGWPLSAPPLLSAAAYLQLVASQTHGQPA